MVFAGDTLLIEPVWNQNCKDAAVAFVLAPPFNRTSLESKLISLNSVASIPGMRTFNRTSLESKLIPFPEQLSFCSLLIEPVWNQNGCSADHFAEGYAFNQTSLESKPSIPRSFPYTSLTFNRTSLESKQICQSHNLRSNAIRLLIEPVWNRNIYSGC